MLYFITAKKIKYQFLKKYLYAYTILNTLYILKTVDIVARISKIILWL